MRELDDITDINLKEVVVRCLSHPKDIKRWNALMKELHYLPFKGLHGRNLRHVAEYQNTWLALVGWQGGSFKLGPRDRFIGWSQDQQFSRLHLIAQNARFLVLKRIPNLASRVLSLSLNRLSSDMETVHGYKVFMAETFVDPSRFTGSCYKACGWQSLGYSKGFSRIRQPGTQTTTWKPNHQPKEIFVKPLTADATTQLSSTTMPSQAPEKKQLKESSMMSLYEYFSQTKDPRRDHGKRYSIAFMMTLLAAARLCGHYGVKETILYGELLPQRILKKIGAYYCSTMKKYRVPAISTLHDLMVQLDPGELQKALREFMTPYHKKEEVIRGASKHVSPETREQVPRKTNPITAARIWVNRMDVEGKIITIND